MGIVYGVGTCYRGKYLITNPDGSLTRERCLWKSMLERCYSKKYQANKPTYIGCTVCEEFLDFQKFMLWAEVQVGFGVHGFRLDKDILIKGNKVYSPETCLFVPHSVNGLFIKKDANRGLYPVGVHACSSGGYSAQCSYYGLKTYLGTYSTPEAAFEHYKKAKEAQIKEVADTYRSVISVPAYNALINYTVEIDD